MFGKLSNLNGRRITLGTTSGATGLSRSLSSDPDPAEDCPGQVLITAVVFFPPLHVATPSAPLPTLTNVLGESHAVR